MSVIKLYPAFKDYLWGGERLVKKYGKHTELRPVAESWELSSHPDGLTRLADGRPLSDVLTPAELGSNCDGFSGFPLLVKLIDAKDKLSVQVHPSDEYALSHENSFGKTEMWYIVDAEEGAGIYLGFRADTTEAAYRAAMEDGTFLSLLNFFPVKCGEAYFIPAGTVHAIGAGCLICEIQQNSNLTYRLYDYNRTDAAGKPRELHTEKALLVSNRKAYSAPKPFLSTGREGVLGISRYFHTTALTVDGEAKLTVDDRSFRALVCIAGDGFVGDERISAGETLLLTAGSGDVAISGVLTLISVQVRRYSLTFDEREGALCAILKDDLGNLLAEEKQPACGATRDEKQRLAEDLLFSRGLVLSDVAEIRW